MNIDLLTPEELTVLTTRLATERTKEKRARAAAARLKRQIAVVDRKLAASQKIALGAALMRAVEASPSDLPTLRGLVLPYITRDTDWRALAGTPFANEAGNAR